MELDVRLHQPHYLRASFSRWLSETENECLYQLIATPWHQLRWYQMLFCSWELFTSPIYISSFYLYLLLSFRNFCWAWVDLLLHPKSVCSCFFGSFTYIEREGGFLTIILCLRKFRSYLFSATSWCHSVRVKVENFRK